MVLRESCNNINLRIIILPATILRHPNQLTTAVLLLILRGTILQHTNQLAMLVLVRILWVTMLQDPSLLVMVPLVLILRGTKFQQQDTSIPLTAVLAMALLATKLQQTPQLATAVLSITQSVTQVQYGNKLVMVLRAPNLLDTKLLHINMVLLATGLQFLVVIMMLATRLLNILPLAQMVLPLHDFILLQLHCKLCLPPLACK